MGAWHGVAFMLCSVFGAVTYNFAHFPRNKSTKVCCNFFTYNQNLGFLGMIVFWKGEGTGER